MRTFIKYFLWFLSFLIILFFYFINTSSGHSNLGYWVESYLSKKTFNDIKVHSLDLRKYPHIVMDITVNGSANVLLEGKVDKYNIDMDYHLKGKAFKFNNFHIEDDIDVNGTLLGPFSKLLVVGKGHVFDGNVVYKFTKVPRQIKNMNIQLKAANSHKVLTFLNKPLIVEGKVDVDANFKSFSNYKKRGQAKIVMTHALMPEVAAKVPFSLAATIHFDDIAYKYVGKIESKIGNLSVTDGTYHQSRKVVQATYALHLKDLAYFEKFLKHKYIGALDTKGSVVYDNGLLVKGTTHKFGGTLDYVYKKENIVLNLKGVYLERLLKQFSYPIVLRSDVFGTVDYNMKNKIVLINTELKKTRFMQTKMTKTIYNTVGIDLLSGEYDNSSFTAGYQNNVLSSELKIDDGKNHLYLVDTKMNAKNNKVNSKFELKMQGQEIYGDIYGTLKNPKVSVDMRKILKYQMNKQMGAWLGTENSEVIKKELKNRTKEVKEKLKDVDLKNVTDGAKLLMDGFF